MTIDTENTTDQVLLTSLHNHVRCFKVITMGIFYFVVTEWRFLSADNGYYSTRNTQ